MFYYIYTFLLMIFTAIIPFNSLASSIAAEEIEEDFMNIQSLSIYEPSQDTEDNYTILMRKDGIGKDFKKLPPEIVIHIAEFLGGQDFQSLCLTRTPIRELLMENKGFFMPEEEIKIIEALKNTSITDIDHLSLKWGREPRKRVFYQLKDIATQNSSYVYGFGSYELPIQETLNQVKLYIKAHRIMAALNSSSSIDALKSAKDENMCNLMTRTNEEELDQDREAALFILVKTAMVSDKVEKIIPEEYMRKLGIDFKKEIEVYWPFGIWIPYDIELDSQI